MKRPKRYVGARSKYDSRRGMIESVRTKLKRAKTNCRNATLDAGFKSDGRVYGTGDCMSSKKSLTYGDTMAESEAGG